MTEKIRISGTIIPLPPTMYSELKIANGQVKREKKLKFFGSFVAVIVTTTTTPTNYYYFYCCYYYY